MEVRARAPGKIILSGEHAVVHGSTAVAASIDLYTKVSIRLSDLSALWWESHGYDTPELMRFAIRVLSLTCSATGCERNWSVFDQIHSKRRNRLEQKRLNALVFVKYNLQLEQRELLRHDHHDMDPICLSDMESDDEWITEKEDPAFSEEAEQNMWMEVSECFATKDLEATLRHPKKKSHENSDGLLELKIKELGLVFSWSIQRIKEMLSELPAPLPLSSPSFSLETLKSVAFLVEEQSFPEAKIELSAGVSAFLCLYTTIQGFKPATVVVSSDLPPGSGLGSSAAFCVSLSAALLASSGALTLDSNEHGWLFLEKGDLELVNKWAFEGEKLIHGKPSGIDNTVSTFGKLTHIKSGSSLKMLITNTKVGRNTKALVAGVSERALRYPDAMAAVFSAVDSISKELSAVIQSPASDDISITEKEEKLQELMEMNQGLLQCMGVSHASIETVLRTTLKYKLASKLTGAGGGGCVLTLLPTLLAGPVVEKVIAELEGCGFQCSIVAIGGKGLEICFDGQS